MTQVIRLPLVDVRYRARACQCTINDLLLAAVTTGLRAMLRERGECPDGLELRASVPVGARSGNPGGMIVVPLPVGTADAARRLDRIAAETRRRKLHPDEGIAGIVAMPASLARLGVAWARHAASSHINLYVTNVPGPPFPLYLAGARLLRAMPVAPLVVGVRLSVTALSYDGTLSIALLADQAITNLPGMAPPCGRPSAGQRETAVAGLSKWLAGLTRQPAPGAAQVTRRGSCSRRPAGKWV